MNEDIGETENADGGNWKGYILGQVKQNQYFHILFFTDTQLQKQATSLVSIVLKSCKYSALNHANITTNNNDND